MPNTARITKLLSQRGVCSRREAEYFLAQGWILVDDRVVDQPGTKAEIDAEIRLHPNARKALRSLVTVMLNKPFGFVSGQAEKNYPSASSLIRKSNAFDLDSRRIKMSHLKNLAPAGRLDIDSTGLLVLTQDGRIAKQLLGENTTVEKEYILRVQGRITQQKLRKLRSGMVLDGNKLKPCQVESIKPQFLKMILIQGRKRQIRRMCDQVELQVDFLKRIRIGNVALDDLPLGKWRLLKRDERFN